MQPWLSASWRRMWPILLLCVTWSSLPRAHAQVGVRMHEVREGGIRINGYLPEWRGVRFTDVGRGDDGSMRFALAYDSAGLYVGAVVRDERIVRTRRPGRREDAVVLTLAMPRGEEFSITEVWLFGGVSGIAASGGIASSGGRIGREPRIRIVEGPRRFGPGYLLEAHVPWDLIEGGQDYQRGRVALRLVDVDSEARPDVENQPTTAMVDRRHPERLPKLLATGGEAAQLRTFLSSQGLSGVEPRHDFRVDVTGDGRAERVVIVDRFVVVMGPGYRDGTAFDFLELPVMGSAGIRSASTRDLTGDGKQELLLRLRQRNSQGSRDLWRVMTFGPRGATPVFGIELRKETLAGFVEASLRLERARRGPALIRVRPGRASGLSADNFRERPATGVEPIVLPWGAIESRSYQWDGSRFAMVEERAREVAPPTQAREPRPAARPSPEPEAPAGGIDALLAAFKRQAGLSASARPSHRFQANVVADNRREHVVVYGRSLLVAGDGYRGGLSFFHFQIPAASDADVLSVRAGDVTGDATMEILVRIRQHVGDVRREILLVHQLTANGFPRLLAAEVARHQGDRTVTNEVSIVGRGRGRHLKIGPARARRWTRDDWPFSDETGDNVAPLLLPWRDQVVHYHYDGAQLRPR